MGKIKIKPFTKWTGGKRQLLSNLLENLPPKYNKYYEPFIGGGALFFEIMPQNAHINDMNTELVLTYKAIKSNVEELIEILRLHKKNNSKEYYLEIREMDRAEEFQNYSSVVRAARLIYMLKVNYNGLYRVNKKNQFNVPYGDNKNAGILEEKLLRSISEFLNTNKIDITNLDFENSLIDVEKGDFVYFDPPYIPLSITSSFTSYTKDGFFYEEQLRLKKMMDKLTEKGVYVMQSNSDTELTRELYKEYNIVEVYASRSINSDSEKRGKVKELIIKNY